MPSGARDLHYKAVRGRHGGSFANPDLTGPQDSVQVDAEDGIYPREAAVLDHGCSAARYLLLGVLEDEDDLSAYPVEVVLQDLGEPDQHGRVTVVAAGVHDPGAGGLIRGVGLLLYRQGVEVCAEGDGRAGALPDYPSDYPVAADPSPVLYPELLQAARDPARSLLFPEREIGVAVEVPPVLDYPPLERVLQLRRCVRHPTPSVREPAYEPPVNSTLFMRSPPAFIR